MRIVITGGTGSLGQALLAAWANKHQLTVVCRNSHSLAATRRQYPGLHYVQADIGDPLNLPVLRQAFRGNDALIHAAAQKVVSEGQYHPEEFVRVNVIGSIYVASAWAEVNQNRPAIAVSTDKAKAALNTYGATKKIMESIFRNRGYSAINYGNVVTSNGSFIQAWQRCRDEGKPLPVVDLPATRFFVSMEMAVKLIENALELAWIGRNGLFIPDSLSAFSVQDVADATGLEQVKIPVGGYEKLHETLLVPGESCQPVSSLLSRVTSPGWEAPDFYELYNSDTTPNRLSGQDVLRLVNWEGERGKK